jgi:hypothetical protein
VAITLAGAALFFDMPTLSGLEKHGHKKICLEQALYQRDLAKNNGTSRLPPCAGLAGLYSRGEFPPFFIAIWKFDDKAL